MFNKRKMKIDMEIEEYNSMYLNNISTFKDAVVRFQKLKKMYEKRNKYVKKNSKEYIDATGIVSTKIEKVLHNIYNDKIQIAFKKGSEEEFLTDLKKIKNELIESYGYGFDNYISVYCQNLDIIIENYKRDYYFIKDFNSKEYDDPIYNDVIDFAIDTGKISVSIIQRRFKVGYVRALKIMNLLEERGIINFQNDFNPSTVLIKLDVNCEDNYDLQINNKLKDNYYKDDEKSNFLEENRIVEKSELKTIKTKLNYDKVININNINNLLFTNSNEDDIEDLMNYFLNFTKKEETKFVLVDFSNFTLRNYETSANLLCPILYDVRKVDIAIQKLIAEMEHRYEILKNKNVKNIRDYNIVLEAQSNDMKDSCKNKMKYIIVVIDELFNLLNYNDIKYEMAKLLLNCKNVGIIFICFSKLNKKNLQLNMLEDLFEIHNDYSHSFLEHKNDEKYNDIDNVDNKMNGFDFEKYAAKILEANEFKKVDVTKCSNDFGVDIIAYKDDIKYAIQCKKYNSPVGLKAVQEVIASRAMNNCHVAVVLTNSSFTKNAISLAEKNNVLLWGRIKLKEMIDIYNKKNKES